MRRILCVSLAILLLMGCTSKRNRTVSGTLKYKGQPLGNVSLRLVPVDAKPDSPTIAIPVNQEGKFSTTGVPAGEYKGVVEGGAPMGRKNEMMGSTKGMDPAKVAEMQEKLAKMGGQQQAAPTQDYPSKYKTVQNTDLKVTIQESGNQDLALELKD